MMGAAGAPGQPRHREGGAGNASGSPPLTSGCAFSRGPNSPDGRKASPWTGTRRSFSTGRHSGAERMSMRSMLPTAFGAPGRSSFRRGTG